MRSTLLQLLMRLPRRLRADRRGNVLMLMAFSVVPLTLAGGIAVDYATAARMQTKLNAAADAAALAAVSQQQMLDQSTDDAAAAARKVFLSQIGNQPGLIWSDSNLTVNVNGQANRTAIVSYTAKVTNAFGKLAGLATTPIGGTSTATASSAPNIDFFLALDTSPSMALPTTSAGFTIMDNAVKCSFACHSNKIQQYVGSSIPTLILDNAHFAINKDLSGGTSGSGSSQIQYIDAAKQTYVYVNRTATDSNCYLSGSNHKDICIYNADGTYVDSYWYALNQGVSLRVTAERSAITDLTNVADTYHAQNGSVYRWGLYTFDHSTDPHTVTPFPSDTATVRTSVGGINLVTVNDQSGNGCPPTGCTGSNRYLFTSFKEVLTRMSTTLPTTGGDGTAGNPQDFLFLVTDGMSDEDIGSGRTRAQMQQQQIDQCTAIKARKIQIAILYTEYTVASIQDDEPGQRAIATAAIPNIAPALQQCASPGLFYTVKTDQSISDALSALFAKAVATARISH